MEGLFEQAKLVMIKNGQHLPQLIVETDIGVQLAIIQLPDNIDKKSQIFFELGRKMAPFNPKKLFFICEAWVSKYERDERYRGLPRNDPHKTEAIVITSCTKEGTKLIGQMTFFKQNGTLCFQKPDVALEGTYDGITDHFFAGVTAGGLWNDKRTT